MHCLHLSLDKVEDDILARHNKHFSQTHYHLVLRGAIMLHYQRHNMPRALRALTSAPTNIRICSICKQKSILWQCFSCQSCRQQETTVNLSLHSVSLSENMPPQSTLPKIRSDLFCNLYIRMILFRTVKKSFGGCQLL